MPFDERAKDHPPPFPLAGLLAFFAIVLPWYGGMYAIHGSDFINEFLGLHNVLRATSSEHPEDNHWYYYLILLPASLLPWAFVSFYEMKMRWKEKGAFYLFLMVWCWGTILFYTLMATKYVTYSYIAVIPAITFAAFGALRIRMGEKLPSILGGLGLLILMAALLVGTFRLKEGNWLVFYAVLAYGLFATSSAGKRTNTNASPSSPRSRRLPSSAVSPRSSPLHDDPIRF